MSEMSLKNAAEERLETGTDETENEIRSAIRFHLEGMKEDGQPILEPSSAVEYVEVAA